MINGLKQVKSEEGTLVKRGEVYLRRLGLRLIAIETSENWDGRLLGNRIVWEAIGEE